METTNTTATESIIACTRCGGTGYFPQYKRVENGVCFRCWGSGTDNKPAPRPPKRPAPAAAMPQVA